MKFIGLDAGSVSIKIVVLDEEGNRIESVYRRHKGRPLHVSLELLKKIIGSDIERLSTHPSSAQQYSLSLTGSAGRLMGSIFNIQPVNEVVAFSYANRKLYPHIRTVIELGGEDSKLIFLGEGSSSVRDFSMNSVCAAGTGSFLDQQAERMLLSIEEFSEMSLKSKKPPRIAGRCSVFAKSDMIHLQQIATPVEDIISGLCFAVARNFKGSIARGREIIAPVSFQGGVAANKGMIRAFKEIFNIEELFIPEEFAIMGALGAVMKDMDSNRVHQFDISVLEDFINLSKVSDKSHSPLITEGDSFVERHIKNNDDMTDKGRRIGSLPFPHNSSKSVKAYLGVDVGSISTNLAVIDEEGNLLAKRYLMTAGRPIEAVRQGLSEIGDEIGHMVEIAGVGTTGSGRYMIADYIGADVVKNEITAQATAAAFIDKDVDTIFEIGGQDSKYIALRDGIIVDFEMNKACAAGTGSFLEEQAEKLGISIKKEFQESAFCSQNPCRLGERCTVFMENSLTANLQRGTSKEDLLAGLAYSIVQNYINRVVCKKYIGERIFFQGGVAFNKAVVAAFEKYLGKKIIVPPHHDVTGAIGMALIARDNVRDRTSFKGFELSRRPYELSSFECRGCSNICEINRVKIEGEKGYLFYGGRCERYDIRRKKASEKLPDLLSFRNTVLWKEHLKRREEETLSFGIQDSRFKIQNLKKNALRPVFQKPRIKIGIPFIFYMHDYLPFWTTLLWELGFDVEVSPPTDRHIIDAGLETVLSETCLPVKVAHGHIKYLIDNKINTIFVPSFVNLNDPGSFYERGFACPYTQTIPYMSKTAFKGINILTPIVDLSKGSGFMIKELKRIFRPFGISFAEISDAIKVAEGAQEDFTNAIKEKGAEILKNLKDIAVVIIGRSYNSLDRGVILDLPGKLSDIGVISIPMDFLPFERIDIRQKWPNMYWRAGQRILSAARIIRENPHLYPIFIGNFSCGPDSFITKFFEEELAGKPFLHLELDSHSADAGVITRCEAFLDSIRGSAKIKTLTIQGRKDSQRVYGPIVISKHLSRTVYIPRMSDHALALAAAFRHCGIYSEVLPESTKESVDLGKRYVSGKECYPCAVTTGDMVKKILEPGFDPSRSAFFMPSGSGPCRFGQYNVFHRMVIEELGYHDIPVFSPNQDENLYRELGIAGKSFAMRSWAGIVAIELIKKCKLEIRPYEKEKGIVEAVYERYLEKIFNELSGTNGDIHSLLKEARYEFENIPKYSEKKPLIGIIGEIFVRSNRFSNEDLIKKIESYGCEAYLTPVEEWVYYINMMAIRRTLIKKDLSDIFNLLLKRFFQKRIEYKYVSYFKGLLRNLHEPDTLRLLDNASPYIHSSFEGEAILSIGKCIDLIQRGASGIINAMPFGCMPGTIVSAILRGIQRETGIPCLSIPYDGTESLTTLIQLEAFIDQAREYRKNN